ncbi:MAG: GH3 auxin-responsive promoter family protein, partial [Dehalococcoidia bacterium]
FVPTSAYFEFLPERELRHTNRGDARQQGDTVLMDELQGGERYEVIITSFYGMPFLRYRTGLMVRVTALTDEDERVFLPQVELVGRSDGLIDLAGFTRLDERTIWDALAAVGMEDSDWMARRENRGEESILALYIEVSDDTNLNDIKARIHAALKERDADYRDVEDLLGINPLEIRPLMPGAFDAYRQAATGTGIQRDMAGWIPKTNAPQTVADRLVELSRRPVRGRGDGHRFLR